MRALVYGAINPDIVHTVERVPVAGEDVRSTAWEITWGGKATNVAVALAAWGVEARLMGLVLGEDALAGALLDAINIPDLNTSWIEQDPTEATRHCLVLLTPDGDRTIVCSGYEAARWREVPADAWTDVDVVVLDGFAGAAAARVAAQARSREIPVVWLDAPCPPPVPVELVVWSRNEHTGDEAAASAATGQALCLTAGPDPIIVWWDGRRMVVAPPEVATADTTGAGDVFAAGCAKGIAEASDPLDMVLWAAAAGAASAASGRGAMPSLDHITRLVERSSVESDTSLP